MNIRQCPVCRSDKVIKFGKKLGRQRYGCNECGHVFLERAGRNVRISSMKVWLYISLYGRIKLGTFGDCDYYAFRCPEHRLQVDYEHVYLEGHYYVECPICKFKVLLRESE